MSFTNPLSDTEKKALQDAVSWLEAGAPLPKPNRQIQIKRLGYATVGVILWMLRLAKFERVTDNRNRGPKTWWRCKVRAFKSKHPYTGNDQSRFILLVWAGMVALSSRVGLKKHWSICLSDE